MNETENPPRKANEYYVATVEKVAAPEGMPGSLWHRYVIQRGKQIIEGMQPGDMNDVTSHAQAFAESLNERFSRTGYAYGKAKK
ncbi:MAG: hypothetical protein OEZ43_15665 [Gammaproteobacteria bacterium]|nr:hypothetical protein [Gammaproteobacteria bacterium]